MNKIDSFIIYMCISGEVNVEYQGGTEILKKGETILIPAVIENYTLNPGENSKLIEVYIEE